MYTKILIGLVLEIIKDKVRSRVLRMETISVFDIRMTTEMITEVRNVYVAITDLEIFDSIDRSNLGCVEDKCNG